MDKFFFNSFIHLFSQRGLLQIPIYILYLPVKQFPLISSPLCVQLTRGSNIDFPNKIKFMLFNFYNPKPNLIIWLNYTHKPFFKKIIISKFLNVLYSSNLFKTTSLYISSKLISYTYTTTIFKSL